MEVDGLSIYYELHGEGSPLVLLHGGLLTIEAAFGDVLPALAERHKVVAIELQGHGRTADNGRPLSLERLADDVAHVLAAIGVDRADVVGFSLGGLVTVELARRHPERVRRLVLASIHTRPEGFHDDVRPPDARPGVGRAGPAGNQLAASGQWVATDTAANRQQPRLRRDGRRVGQI